MLVLLGKLSTAALGFDAFCLNKKFLVFNLVDRNLKVKYRRSFFGFFWTILSPLCMSAIYYFVFKIVLRVERPHYLPFILSGVLPWTFFNQSLIESTDSLVSNQGLISKIPIPLQVFPYVVTLTNFSTLALSIPIIFILALISGVTLTWTSLLVFFHFAGLLLISYCFGAILSILYVYLRDIKHALGLIMQFWFYGTPILYDKSMIPEKYHFIVFLNPVGSIFVGIQSAILGRSEDSLELLLSTALWSFAALLLLRLIFNHFRKGLVEIL